MNKEKVPKAGEKTHPEDAAPQLSPEVLDMIKHPPKMDDVIRGQSPAERRGNPALVPEMLEQPIDETLMDDRE
ncbi:hypothetical protein PN465_00895 [Nodularia spumigena CS-584]|jgi:hypothetical protein|uniref:Uncharacterized protein n=2 Tax=Nodularia spumigena TaxID=70799 RepID=A0A2S0Q5G5_NODSP|nr:hypothetical protein [Nodularia spumigena]AHJ26892.1 hypothetical protein NSP_5420 [Nodularia spumigena CCY9414]AVZ29572.1 hypothetical protein BMF81_00278 [Nodularia spumigena UHCC 0039]EAW45445.1 hypothetical protein N9414_03835 [Nodularia spumigena CCY9414]MDB9380801.1 hypothetical protein [Nodularia spumigena CS-584]MEA5527882.1 hypothetical protein [Nodularia spumigena UHCC 0143]